jgi:hypothetical protein
MLAAAKMKPLKSDTSTKGEMSAMENSLYGHKRRMIMDLTVCVKTKCGSKPKANRLGLSMIALWGKKDRAVSSHKIHYRIRNLMDLAIPRFCRELGCSTIGLFKHICLTYHDPRDLKDKLFVKEVTKQW